MIIKNEIALLGYQLSIPKTRSYPQRRYQGQGHFTNSVEKTLIHTLSLFENIS